MNGQTCPPEFILDSWSQNGDKAEPLMDRSGPSESLPGGIFNIDKNVVVKGDTADKDTKSESKMIKTSPRAKIKLSCKVRKCKNDKSWIKSPKSSNKKNKKKYDKKNDDTDKETDDPKEVEPKIAHKNRIKVKKMISVFEENIKLSENTTRENVIGKIKLENAYMKMINSSGRNTPSPRKRLKKRRLKSEKSQEGCIEAWIKREKM